jgi:hypothetical protein
MGLAGPEQWNIARQTKDDFAAVQHTYDLIPGSSICFDFKQLCSIVSYQMQWETEQFIPC